MSVVHNFKASLAKGALGEELFLKMHPTATRTDGRKSDFILADGTKLELKTDSYSMDSTPNFFIELYSDVDRAKPGGPVQALSHGSTRWAYLYIQDKTMFVFDTQELIERIEVLLKTGLYKKRSIPNRSWTTVGVLIPRAAIQDLATVHQLENVEESVKKD